MTLSSIDIGQLLELVWIAPLAAVAVSITFASCVLGATRSSDARRAGEPQRSAVWLGVAFVAGLAVAAEVAAGISVIVAG